jgi:hypothetical protein
MLNKIQLMHIIQINIGSQQGIATIHRTAINGLKQITRIMIKNIILRIDRHSINIIQGILMKQINKIMNVIILHNKVKHNNVIPIQMMIAVIQVQHIKANIIKGELIKRVQIHASKAQTENKPIILIGIKLAQIINARIV